MIDTDLETLKEVKGYLDSNTFSNREKVKYIASMLFNELSEEEQLEILYEMGDDFEFYLNIIKNIEFDSYDGDCIRDMHELITDKFISMNTFPSDKMKSQYKKLNYLMK